MEAGALSPFHRWETEALGDLPCRPLALGAGASPCTPAARLQSSCPSHGSTFGAEEGCGQTAARLQIPACPAEPLGGILEPAWTGWGLKEHWRARLAETQSLTFAWPALPELQAPGGFPLDSELSPY